MPLWIDALTKASCQCRGGVCVTLSFKYNSFVLQTTTQEWTTLQYNLKPTEKWTVVTREACFLLHVQQSSSQLVAHNKRTYSQNGCSNAKLKFRQTMSVQLASGTWTLKIKTTVFNSGLGTFGPHFLFLGAQCFWGETFLGGWLCWKLLSTDKTNPEHLSIDSWNGLRK